MGISLASGVRENCSCLTALSSSARSCMAWGKAPCKHHGQVQPCPLGIGEFVPEGLSRWSHRPQLFIPPMWWVLKEAEHIYFTLLMPLMAVMRLKDAWAKEFMCVGVVGCAHTFRYACTYCTRKRSLCSGVTRGPLVQGLSKPGVGTASWWFQQIQLNFITLLIQST